jgi:hypothetical protein
MEVKQKIIASKTKKKLCFYFVLVGSENFEAKRSEKSETKTWKRKHIEIKNY